MYRHLPTSMTHKRSRAYLSPCTVPLYTVHNKPRITAYYIFHVQPEDGHCQAPNHVVVPYVINSIYTSTIKQSCITQVHTPHSS